MLQILMRHIQTLFKEISHGYAWVALVPAWQAGMLLALMTFIEPVVGLFGLLGALSSWYAGQIAGANSTERPICVFNGLLSGLFVAHTWSYDFSATISLITLTLLAGIFSGWLTVVLGRLTWSLVQLPILSMPFALVAMLTTAAGSSLSTVTLSNYIAPPDMFGSQIDKFLSAFGNLYFIPNAFVGTFIVAILLVFSRYYLLVAVVGYLSAKLLLYLIGAIPEHLAASAWDSNAILAALLIGGLFSSPSWRTLALAALAAVISAWLSLALARILDVAQLIPFSMPFVLAAWIVLYAVMRNTKLVSNFNLLLPDFPERSYERSQISRARVGAAGSLPFALPFNGEWTVSQGFSGNYTHRGPWRHALDFIITRDGKSYSGNGSQLEDFYCYNQPVLSPVYGQVWHVANEVADNTPGTVNVVENWGNHVLIRLADASFALVAHLKPASIVVLPGTWVKPGDLLGYCGNSGRSPQPHIHMHRQISEEMGATTTLFHLASVMRRKDGAPPHYALAVVPKEHDTLSAAVLGDVRPIYLLAGRGLRYTVAQNENIQIDWSIHCEVDDLGRLVLISSSGARCLVESTWAVFSCYERNGSADPYFDLWLLACGFTPVSFQIERWQDNSTLARLLPNRLSALMAGLIWPWATFTRSEYQRKWEGKEQGWRQRVTHRQPVSSITLEIDAVIEPQIGCTYISALLGKECYIFQATSVFQRADIGVQGWESPLSTFKTTQLVP